MATPNTFVLLTDTSTPIRVQQKVKGKGKAVLFTGLEWPRGFQEVKVPRFHDNDTGWW